MVIAIIGVLASVVLASLNTARVKARDVRRLSDIRQIILALNFASDTTGGTFPTSSGGWRCLGQLDGTSCWGGAVTGGLTSLTNALTPYLSTIPRDPSYPSGCNGDAYVYNSNVVDYAGAAPQAYVHWAIEQPVASLCAGGRYGVWSGSCVNGRSYCVLYVGPPTP